MEPNGFQEEVSAFIQTLRDLPVDEYSKETFLSVIELRILSAYLQGRNDA